MLNNLNALDYAPARQNSTQFQDREYPVAVPSPTSTNAVLPAMPWFLFRVGRSHAVRQTRVYLPPPVIRAHRHALSRCHEIRRRYTTKCGRKFDALFDGKSGDFVPTLPLKNFLVLTSRAEYVHPRCNNGTNQTALSRQYCPIAVNKRSVHRIGAWGKMRVGWHLAD